MLGGEEKVKLGNASLFASLILYLIWTISLSLTSSFQQNEERKETEFQINIEMSDFIG